MTTEHSTMSEPGVTLLPNAAREPSPARRPGDRVMALLSGAGIGFVAPLVRLVRGEDRREQAVLLWRQIGIPLVAILLFLGLWSQAAARIDTSLGRIPGPVAVWVYAVSSKQVAEIFQPLAITSLPNIPEWLLGITNFRNDIISVIDLLKLWEKKDLSVSPKPKLVVLRSANDESLIAFTIDKFSEIVTLPDENIQAVKETDFPYIYGKTIHKSNTINLIDAEKLLSLSL